MRVMRAWHACPRWNIALGAAAKCGSTTLARLVADNDICKAADPRLVRVGRSDVPKGLETVAVIRHPVDRFASLYANIQQRHRSRNNYYAQFEGLGPSAVLDRIIECGIENEFHTQRQCLALGEYATGVRLEAFGRWFAARFPDAVPPQHLNESRQVDIDDRTAERVLSWYARDFKLWEAAHA
jgi:hypothetical protein